MLGEDYMHRTLYAVSSFACLMVSLAAIAGPPTGKYKTVVDQMTALQASNPSVVSLFSIGENNEGTSIMAMRISTAPQAFDPKKIGQLVVAVHHGNEGKGMDVAMNLAKKLIKQYTSWDLVQGNLADMEWTIVPVLNISGFNAGVRNEYGYDANRNYPGPCISQPGGDLGSIRSVMKLLTTRVYTGAVTLHGYIGSMTYPWGIAVGNTHTLDHNAYAQITAKAAEQNGYQYGTSTDIVYPCDGTYEDYVYWKHGAWSLLIELQSGNPTDVDKTADALLTWFSLLDSSPSTKNQLTSACLRDKPIDLHLE